MPNVLRVAISTIGAAFCMGAIFWAGATYNRIDSMDKHMGNVDASIALVLNKLGDLQTVQMRVEENEKRIERLENQVKMLK